MRITTGYLKGRKVSSKIKGEVEGFRPTSSKVKQAIFNIIVHNQNFGVAFLENTSVLDLCCGTGILGLEALSRGAKAATFIDKNIEVLKLAESNLLKIDKNLHAKCTFLKLDAFELPFAQKAFGLIFLDPPYHQKDADKILDILVKRNWIENGGFIVLESQKNFKLSRENNKLQIIIERKYGNTKLFFLKNAS